MRGALPAVLVAALALALGGCSAAAPVPVPSGPMRTMPGTLPIDGEAHLVGDGTNRGLAWRLWVWRSADLVCRQLETVTLATQDCGRAPLTDGVRLLTADADVGGARAWHGIVGPAVERIVARSRDGERSDVPVLPLPDGLTPDGAAFATISPTTDPIVEIVAFDADGAVIEKHPLP